MTQEILELSPTNGVFEIEFWIWNKAQSVYSRGTIIVDTGAAVTSMHPDVLQWLGYKPLGTTLVTTASKTETVEKYMIDSIKLGNSELHKIEINAHCFPDLMLSDGLLGINVLSQFDVSLLFSKKQIVFA